MIRKKTAKTALVMAFSSLLATTMCVDAQPRLDTPSLILQRQIDQQQQLQQQQDQQQKQTEKPAVIEGVPDPAEVQQKNDVAPFLLQSLVFNEAEVFTAQELADFSKTLINKKVNLQQLRGFSTKLERHYLDSGFIARVILPPQKIVDGVVTLRIIEARAGDQVLQGNSSTDSTFIMSRLDLSDEGEILDIKQLERSLVKINNVYDVNVRAELKPGAVFASSDILLALSEPKKHQLSLLLDNYGNNSTGDFQRQLAYSNVSLSGNRDRLDTRILNAEGSTNGSLAYSFFWPGSNIKTLLFYAMSEIEIINGPISDLGVEGDSNIALIDISKPVWVTESSVLSVNASYDNSDSDTSIGSVELESKSSDTAKIGLSYWSRGESSYWSGNVAIGQGETSGVFNSIAVDDVDYNTYNADSFYYYAFNNPYNVILRGNIQFSGDKGLPSAGQYQIGGIGSVRGYDNGLLSGDSGYIINAELHRNFDASSLQKGSAIDGYVFIDNGQVDSGDSRRDENLLSVGLGADWKLRQGINISTAFAWATTSIAQEADDIELYLKVTVPLLDLW
jgi:hemolysin activation/secretion protein